MGGILLPTYLLVVVLLGGCTTAAPSQSLPLPRTIGGVEILYNRVRAADSLWAVDIAEQLSVPIGRVAVLTGYRDQFSTYNSDIIHVPGISDDRLLEATILAFYPGAERRVDVIEGKSVTRALSQGEDALDDAPYFYAFGEVAIVIVGSRPFVEEALRELP